MSHDSPHPTPPSFQSKLAQSKLPAGLYLVATPIGNLGDITLRALDTLKQAELIACEDTRVSLKLLNHFGIRAPLVSYNEHNAEARHPALLKALAEGKRVALISDAGTPLLSDPGQRLVSEVLKAGFAVTPIPGVSSLITAFCAAGLPSHALLFRGFLPVKAKERQKIWQEAKPFDGTLALFESANRLPALLEEIEAELGNRSITVARELTKRHETFWRGTVAEARAHFITPPKGEIVVLIGPDDAPPSPTMGDGELRELLTAALAAESLREAVDAVTLASGRKRKEVYALALELKK